MGLLIKKRTGMDRRRREGVKTGKNVRTSFMDDLFGIEYRSVTSQIVYF